MGYEISYGGKRAMIIDPPYAPPHPDSKWRVHSLEADDSGTYYADTLEQALGLWAQHVEQFTAMTEVPPMNERPVTVRCGSCQRDLASPLSREEIEMLQMALMPHITRKGVGCPEWLVHAKLVHLRAGLSELRPVEP